jgi:hypothetical protein
VSGVRDSLLSGACISCSQQAFKMRESHLQNLAEQGVAAWYAVDLVNSNVWEIKMGWQGMRVGWWQQGLELNSANGA